MLDPRDVSRPGADGATLANGGVNPVSGVRALAEEYVDNVLSVMATCGMYDFSGEWLYRTACRRRAASAAGSSPSSPAGSASASFPRASTRTAIAFAASPCAALAADLGCICSTRPNRRAGSAWRRRVAVASEAASSAGCGRAPAQSRKAPGRTHLQGPLAFAAVSRWYAR